MEKKLKVLFDYQRFERNASLEALIQETEARYARELSDDELTMVAAAGEMKDMMEKYGGNSNPIENSTEKGSRSSR